MRITRILLACLCLAACGREAAPEPPPPPAAPAKSAEQRAIERRLRQIGDVRYMDEKTKREKAREKALRDAMHSPVHTLPEKAPR